jgi:DNA-binding PadR family transcriptional regulator
MLQSTSMMSDLPETTYAVLGLLDKTPSSGYDLAALADRSLDYFWPISRTLVYRELGRLESLGWVRSEPVPQDRLPDKSVWSTTEEGRRALAGWLAQPALTGSGNRNGFLLKFFLGARMSPKATRALLEDYRNSLEATRADLAALIERLAGKPRARLGRLSALHGLRTAEARLTWIDEVEAELTESSERRTRAAATPPTRRASSHTLPAPTSDRGKRGAAHKSSGVQRKAR